MSSRSFLAVLFSVLAGTIIWAVHFTIIYGFTSTACARGLGTDAVPWAVAVATGIAVLAAAAVIVRSLRPVRGRPRAITPRRRISSAGSAQRSPGWRWSQWSWKVFRQHSCPPACSAGRQDAPDRARLRSIAPSQAAIRATLPTR
jgi:hypothetical protein